MSMAVLVRDSRRCQRAGLADYIASLPSTYLTALSCVPNPAQTQGARRRSDSKFPSHIMTQRVPGRWNETELSTLCDPHLVSVVQVRQARLRERHGALNEALRAEEAISWETWLWAAQSVASRAFNFKQTPEGCLRLAEDEVATRPEEEVEVACLLPIIDTANHCFTGAQTRVEFAHRDARKQSHAPSHDRVGKQEHLELRVDHHRFARGQEVCNPSRCVFLCTWKPRVRTDSQCLFSWRTSRWKD